MFAIVVLSLLIGGGALAAVALHGLQRRTSATELSREDAETARRTFALGEAGIANTMAARGSAAKQ